MGFAFSIDDLIDSGHYDGMNTGWNPVSPSRYHPYFEDRIFHQTSDIYEKVRSFERASKSNDVETVKRTRKEIENELNELETQRYYYRVAEKNTLRVKNKTEIRTVVISEIIEGLLDFYNESCYAIAEIQDEIKKNTSIQYKASPKEQNESIIKKDITKNIFDIVSNGIASGLPLSREMFKNLVKDLEVILELLDYSGRTVKKLDVEEYFVCRCNKRIGMIVCQNCNRPMLADIPYCFNCFDGRYA